MYFIAKKLMLEVYFKIYPNIYYRTEIHIHFTLGDTLSISLFVFKYFMLISSFLKCMDLWISNL